MQVREDPLVAEIDFGGERDEHQIHVEVAETVHRRQPAPETLDRPPVHPRSAVAERRIPAPRTAVDGTLPTTTPALVARTSTGPLAGSVFDRAGWGTFMHQLRERTVRKS